MADITADYRSGPADWHAFLSCWRQTVNARLAVKPGYTGLLALPRGVNQLADNLDNLDLQTLSRLQAKLSHRLPKSYLDFLAVTQGRGWVIEIFSEQLPSGEVVGGVLPLNAIGMFPETDPATYATWTNQPSIGRAITPQEYYRYGFQPDYQHRQNPALFHAEALAHMIKVGDMDQGGVLLLNPKEVTADGEMEAWALSFQTHAERYRSFAELMQDMAYADCLPEATESVRVVPGVYDRCPCVKLLRTAASA